MYCGTIRCLSRPQRMHFVRSRNLFDFNRRILFFNLY